MNDTLSTAIILFIGPLTALIVVTWLLRFFVALKAPPRRRAAWTAGIGYIIVVGVCTYYIPGAYWWVPPLTAIPGTLIMFWWWQREFRNAWIEASDEGFEDVKLANDDWRVGLLLLGGLIVLLAIRVVIRLVVGK